MRVRWLVAVCAFALLCGTPLASAMTDACACPTDRSVIDSGSWLATNGADAAYDNGSRYPVCCSPRGTSAQKPLIPRGRSWPLWTAQRPRQLLVPSHPVNYVPDGRRHATRCDHSARHDRPRLDHGRSWVDLTVRRDQRDCWPSATVASLGLERQLISVQPRSAAASGCHFRVRRRCL